MKITPEHVPVGKLFHDNLIFDVPKYQRGYAWGETEVSDFLDDFQKAYDKRTEGNPIKHFFGGIVSVVKDIEGAAHQKKYEIVDGQQRIATFVILMSRITKIYNGLLDEAIAKGDDENVSLIEKRIENLKREYFDVEIEINREIRRFKRLGLSKSDDSEFRDLLHNREIQISRNSHKRLEDAFENIEERVNSLLDGAASIPDKLDVLEKVKKLIDDDFSVIHIVTEDKKVAYKLFQVLNNRGISLTEGDLLRAKTLELLDPDEFSQKQDTVENAWDNILIDPPTDTENYLRWTFASYEGIRPGKSTLFEDFLNKFYPEHNNDDLTEGDAENIVNTTLELKKEFKYLRKLSSGDWPFETISNDITDWDADRLKLLMVELKHNTAIPLLLSACKLSQQQFLEIVLLTERIYFRYKLVCREHEGSLNNLYQREAKKIRDDSENYDINAYKTELIDLQSRKANNDKFSYSLDDFIYRNSGGNKKIRYFLLTTEYAWRWLDEDTAGEPVFLKDIVHTFSTTSIEHIYPQNPEEDDVIEDLDDKKHDLGNLTILTTDDNQVVENSSFNDKKAVFKVSKLLINNRICDFEEWDIENFKTRHQELKKAAEKIFTIS